MEHKETNEDIISVASLISGKNNSIFVETKIETNNHDEIEEEKENVNDEYIIENEEEEEDNDLEKKGDIVNDSNQTQEIINQKKDIIISDINTGEKNVFIEMEKRSYHNNAKLSLSKLLYVFPYPIKEDVHDLTDKPPECYTAQYSRSRSIAMGFSSGEIDVITNYNKRIQIKASTDPISSLRFHPEKESTILAITSIGEVIHLHSISGRKLSQFVLEDRTLRALDYNKQGELFAIGTSDSEVMIYNENMEILDHTFKSGTSFAKGHVDQVHSVLFPVNDPNAVISGGRDKRVVFWDIRSEMASSMIVGPLIMGDSVDIKKNILLTGSYDINDGIQLWDLRMMKVIKEYKTNSMIYCCKYNKGETSNLFACGGYKKNEMKVFNTLKGTEYVSGICASTYPIYSLDFSIDGKYLLYGSEDGGARIVEL